MSAAVAACALARGVRKALPDARILQLPLSDGGEGFASLLTQALGGRLRRATVQGPLPSMRARAVIGWHAASRTAIIESAQAVGLVLLAPGQRNPLRTTTHGLGEMILHALRWNPRRILIGLGGTSTCDGGAGMLEALGWTLERSRTGCVSRMAPGIRLKGVRIIAACDVTNPLLGRRGAAQVFGPQKGATPADVAVLEARMKSFADAAVRSGFPRQRRLPGAGAAGGLGWALVTFLGARLQSGIDLFLDAAHFERRFANADLILTGEGSLDRQSLSGKAAVGLARRAAPLGVPVVALAGKASLTRKTLQQAGIQEARTIAPAGVSVEQSMRHAAKHLAAAAAEQLADVRAARSGRPKFFEK